MSNAKRVAEARKVVENATEEPSKPPYAGYTVRGFVELANTRLKPLEHLFNGIELNPGSLAEIIGPPSIGKSRYIGDLARHQILHREFCGLETLKASKRWLFMGTENGIHRLNREACAYLYHLTPEEISGMNEAELRDLAGSNGFTPADLAALEENYKAFTLEAMEDFDINLAEDSNVTKIVATLLEFKPDILVVDPWGDIIAGDELHDADIRATVRMLRQCLNKAGLDNAFMFIINHARIGAKEEANAKGTEAGNFGKNSKCLYSISRYVINIRRASFDDNPPIEIICAKNNDGKRPESFAVKLDPVSMSYSRVEEFDADAWQAKLDEVADIKRGAKSADKSSDAMRRKALEILDGPTSELMSVTQFKEKMSDAGFPESKIRDFLKARRDDRGDDRILWFQRELKRDGEAVREKRSNEGGVEFISTHDRINHYRYTQGLKPLE